MSMRAVTIAGFTTLVLMAVALWALGRARVLGLAPLGEVLDVLSRFRAVRLVLAGGWMWLGWHLLAR